MKKFLSLILTVIISVCLFACAAKENNKETENSSASVTTASDITSATADTGTTASETTQTTANSRSYTEVPRADVSYSHIYLSGKEISYFNILGCKTISTIIPERTIYHDGEGILMSKHMLPYKDKMPVYDIGEGDLFEIENVGNSEMKYREVLDMEGNAVECSFDKLWELPAGEYYLRFDLTEKANEYLFKDTYDEGIWYVETWYCSYVIINVK